MNYQKEYDELIKYRKDNILSEGYYETHHIKPKCFFEKNTYKEIINHEDNLVKLKANEHFKAHYFLFMLYKDTSNYNKCKKMFGSFKLVLDKVKLHDVEYIDECSNLYENGRQEHNLILEQEGLDKINLICDWIDKTGNTPKKHSNIKDEYEKSLGNKLSNLKLASKGKEKLLFCESYQELVESRGYPDLFISRTPEQKGLDDIKIICSFIDKNKKEPSQHSICKEEKKLGNILVKLRQNKRNKTAFFESYETLTENLNHSEIFELCDREEEIKNTIKHICKFIDENGITPKRKDIRHTILCNISNEENSLAVALDNYIKGKNKESKMNWNNEYDNIANKCGYPYLFAEKRLLTHILKVKKLRKFIKCNGIPKFSKNRDEYLLLRKYKKMESNNKYLKEELNKIK